MDIEQAASTIVNAAMKVHSALARGYWNLHTKNVWHMKLEMEGLSVESEVVLPIMYEKIRRDAGCRVDMIVEDLVIVEDKTVEKMMPIHEAQLLIYLKLSGRKLGFLLNWNVPRMKDGIKRMVNHL